MASISVRLMPSSAPRNSMMMPGESTAAISAATAGRGLCPITTTPMRWCFNGLFIFSILQNDQIGGLPVEHDRAAGREQPDGAGIGLLRQDVMSAFERDAIEHRAAEEVGAFDDALGASLCPGACRVARGREADLFRP